MLTYVSRWATSPPLLALLATALLTVTSMAQTPATDRPSRSYRVILFLAEDGAPRDVKIQRLKEVWREGEGAARLRELLGTREIQRLDDVTILPGRETPAIRLGDVTVRVNGVLKEPRGDRMFLRVEVDSGEEAFVKEMISRFDETIVLAYPLARGDRSIVALIVPTGDRHSLNP